MDASAVLPVKRVTTLRTPPYSRTCPSLRSTQYHTSKTSKAPRLAIKGKMLGEKRYGTPGKT